MTTFDFLPAPRKGGFRMKDYWVWCGAPILGEDGRYHLFASRWSKDVTFMHWVMCSEIVRAAADRPEGPYQFEEIVLAPRDDTWDGKAAHNPAIQVHEGTYLLFYTGVHYTGERPTQAGQDGQFSPKWAEAWNNKRLGLATAPSIHGPWTRRDEPILQTRPGKWDSALTSNAAPCVHDDGSVTLVYKSANVPHPEGPYPGRFRMGAARASHWSQPFERLSGGPVRIDDHPDLHIEDGHIWWNGKVFELLAKDMTGEMCGEAQAGIHATSPDAIHWRLSDPAKAYSRNVLFEDGEHAFAKFERPNTLRQNGKPTHLFGAVMEKDADGNITDSWTCCVPVRG